MEKNNKKGATGPPPKQQPATSSKRQTEDSLLEQAIQEIEDLRRIISTFKSEHRARCASRGLNREIPTRTEMNVAIASSSTSLTTSSATPKKPAPLPINKIDRMTESIVSRNHFTNDRCTICLESSFTNQSYIDGCFHRYCYECIIKWSQVKASCPVCIRPITKVYHNIQSEHVYFISEVVPQA